MEPLTPNQVLDILAEAMMLLFKEEHWSKNCCATSQGTECPPWDLHADAWSSFGAIEKTILNSETGLSHLTQVVLELEQDAQEPLLPFDSKHTHEEVIGLFYTTMRRISAGLNLVMMTPAFMAEAKDWPTDEFPVMFIEQAALDAMDQAEEEHKKRREEAYAEERRLMRYDREDELGTFDAMDELD